MDHNEIGITLMKIMKAREDGDVRELAVIALSLLKSVVSLTDPIEELQPDPQHELKGVILYRSVEIEDTPQEYEAMTLLNIPIKTYEEGTEFEYQSYDWEMYEDVMNKRHDALEKLTMTFMCGGEDGTDFYFTDTEEDLEHIKTVFPEFKVVAIDGRRFSLDYDYRRDI